MDRSDWRIFSVLAGLVVGFMLAVPGVVLLKGSGGRSPFEHDMTLGMGWLLIGLGAFAFASMWLRGIAPTHGE